MANYHRSRSPANLTHTITDGTRSRLRRIALALLAFVTTGSTLPAQEARPRPERHPVGRRVAPLARYAPASSKLFISVRRLDELDAAMRRAHAWRLLPLLTGNPGATEPSFSLRGALGDFIGPTDSIRVEDLMEAESALVAPSWLELNRSVWLVRPSDKAVLDRWAKGGPRPRDVASSANFFATDTGLMVCVKGDVAAVARAGGKTALTDTMMLMAGRPVPLLERDALFQELLYYLPAGPLAVAYSRQGESGSPAGSGSAGLIGSDLDRTVMGLYEGDGRLDVAVRGSLARPQADRALAREAVIRLVELPQTTLLATAFKFSPDAVASTPPMRHGQMVGRLLTLLQGLRGGEEPDAASPPALSPHLVLAWDQDLRPSGSTPQVALLAQSPNIGELQREIDHIAGNAIRLIGAIDTTDQELRIEQSTHLGTPISYISLTQYAKQSRYPMARLFEHVEPAWAVMDDWLVFALSRDHVERILDAHRGLAPTLTGVPDVQVLTADRVERMMTLTIVQADLAADILGQWVTAHESGSPSLLDPQWWGAAGDGGRAIRSNRLGIGMKSKQESGVVVVARVYPATAAADRLQPGDRIIGIDGRLLDLVAPNQDLRTRWNEKPGDSRTVRVQRGGDTLDIVLESVYVTRRPAATAIKPADAVRELASLAASLQFASFASYATDESRYSAKFSLRFTPPRKP